MQKLLRNDEGVVLPLHLGIVNAEMEEGGIWQQGEHPLIQQGSILICGREDGCVRKGGQDLMDRAPKGNPASAHAARAPAPPLPSGGGV